ncbi:Putative F-box protein At1g32420 [Linum grandiflorum]
MRFKCVCKAWKWIIEQDSNFINLHYTHSEARPGLLIMALSETEKGYGGELYLKFGELHSDRRGANFHSVKRIGSPMPKDVHLLGPVRGLLCLVDRFAVQICNVSTGVVAPWIKSAVSMTVRNRLKKFGNPECFFGFDAATGNHKVMYLWSRYKKAPPICEVLTVGESSWRIIDSVPPREPGPTTSLCVNGSVYWLTCWGSTPWDGFQSYNSESDFDYLDSESMMVFDFGSEQFRMIPIPKFTRLVLPFQPVFFTELIDMDGCPTMIRYDHVDDDDCIRKMKMWKFQDYNKNNKAAAATANVIASSSEKDWTEVVIRPPSSLPNNSFVFFHSIPGEDVMILESYARPLGLRLVPAVSFLRNVKSARFCRYDLKTETFSKFEVKGIPFLPNDCFTRCSILVESLFPVEKTLQQN